MPTPTNAAINSADSIINAITIGKLRKASMIANNMVAFNAATVFKISDSIIVSFSKPLLSNLSLFHARSKA